MVTEGNACGAISWYIVRICTIVQEIPTGGVPYDTIPKRHRGRPQADRPTVLYLLPGRELWKTAQTFYVSLNFSGFPLHGNYFALYYNVKECDLYV